MLNGKLQFLYCDCHCKYLIAQKILYVRQFGFQTNHPTEISITNLADNIHESFAKDCFTLEIFIDLSEAFNIEDQDTLLKKLKMYGIRATNHAWFCTCLSKVSRL